MGFQKKLFWALLLCCMAMFVTCNPPEIIPEDMFSDQHPPPEEGVFEPGTGEIGPDGHPVGWTEESHGKIKQADYIAVFGTRNSEVLRFDIVIAPSDWQAKTAEEAFYPERMQAIYASVRALIEPYVIGEYGEVQGYTNLDLKSTFINEFDLMNNYVESRYDVVQTFLRRN